jgi:transcriptional regulator with XRE-family HTH domain
MTRKMTLDSHVTQRGLFARVARKLRIDPSYVSRVANGKRNNERISQSIAAELSKTKHQKANRAKARRETD